MTDAHIIETLIALVVAAYGFIFYSIINRIKKLESNPICPILDCKKKFERLEDRYEKLNPVFEDIKERLVRIETVLEELRKK